MAVDDPLNGSKADTDAREFVLPMQPLKWLEEQAGMPHLKTDPVIGNAKP